MTETNLRRELLGEIINRKNVGEKKFHSETSLQHFGEEEDTLPPRPLKSYEDPGVLNLTVNDAITEGRRRRTVSQPGPVSGSLLTATAARAARRKPQRNVAYAADVNENIRDDTIPKIVNLRGDESGTATPTGDRDRSSPFQLNMYNSNNRNGDTKSLNNYRIYTPMNGGGTPRKRSVMTWDAQSLRSMETQAPPPTSSEDNKRQTKKYLTLIASTMYALLIITLGVIFNVSGSLLHVPVAPIYTMVLGATGLLYLIYLMNDINSYKKTAVKNQNIKTQYEEKMQEYFRSKAEELSNTSPDDKGPEPFRPPNIPPPVLIPLKHVYCFSQGRHSGSFYLKLGAAGFAMGSLVHSVLLITMQMGYLFDEQISNDDCVNYFQVIVDCFNPILCFVQLYFIFKYSNVIILHREPLAYFGFMHLIGSSLCFWVGAIVRETVLALTLYAQSVYGGDGYGDSDYAKNLTILKSESLRNSVTSNIIDVSGLYDENCLGVSAINKVFENFSPYLYPFSVEFNILIVAVYYIIWSNIGHCHNEDNDNSVSNNSIDDGFSVCRIPTANEENDFTSNMVIYADCHASNRGLFAGLILMVIIVGVLIIGFVFSSVGDIYLGVGYLLNDATKLGLHSIMLLCSVVAFTQTIKLDINEHSISLLDDILLYICLPLFFMETVFSLFATINILNVLKSIDVLVMVVQVLVQTPLIMDALRRCCNARKLRRAKPGREVIMFLIISNVAMWLFYTFSYKSPDSLDERYEFYGKVLWTILGHVSLPLIMFYRFHSSVCFVDIWGSAYQPGSEH